MSRLQRMLDGMFFHSGEFEKVEDGGEGSGNFGHKGRPGLVGGSGEGGGSSAGSAPRVNSVVRSVNKMLESGSHEERIKARKNFAKSLESLPDGTVISQYGNYFSNHDRTGYGRTDYKKIKGKWYEQMGGENGETNAQPFRNRGMAREILGNRFSGTSTRRMRVNGHDAQIMEDGSLTTDFEWKEEAHPRDKLGRFAKVVGNASNVAVQSVIPKDAERSLGVYAELANEKNSAQLERLGIEPEVAEAARKTIARLLDRYDYGVRVPRSVLRDILDDHLINCFEDTSYMDAEYDADRRAAEHGLYGVAPDADIEPMERPRYGYLSGGPDEEAHIPQANDYGEVLIGLKKEEFDGRVTYTIEDSFNSYEETCAGSVNVCGTTLGGFDSGEFSIRKLAEMDIEGKSMRRILHDARILDYIELQFHGSRPISIGQIAYLFFDEMDDVYNMPMSLFRKIRAAGIPIYYANDRKAEKFGEELEE